MPRASKFSILIPFHNSHDTIRDTILSVIEQDAKLFEIVIADDRSSVTSRVTINELAAADERIRVIDSAGPGPSAARNTAVAAATGDILCFLDADDCLRPGALHTYEKAFRRIPELGAAFGRVRITPDPSLPGGVITPFCPTPTLAQIIGENRVCTTSNIVVRREAFAEIGGFNESLSHAEDQEWLARAFLNKRWLLRGIDRVTLDYRTSPDGLSSDLQHMEQGWLKMLRTFQASEACASRRQMAMVRGVFYRYLARRALRLGASRIDGAAYISRAIKSCPQIIFNEAKRTWATTLAAFAVFLFGVRPFQKILH